MVWRVTSVDFDVAGGRWAEPTDKWVGDPGEAVLVGREGDLAVAIDPLDSGVSRRALEIRVSPDHWEIDVFNSNHAWVHPWGQRPVWVESASTLRKRWPRVGVLVMGRNEQRHHWILLETDEFTSQWRDRHVADASHERATQVKPAAGGLTSSQLEAIELVFGGLLAWPPSVNTAPTLLDAAARRLQIAPTAVSERLRQAQNRAYSLGPHRQTGVMEPEWVYVLASAGYLPIPEFFGSGATD